MPRTNTNIGQTEFYRLLIESFYNGEWHETMYYGPYCKAGSAKSTISGAEKWYARQYEKGTRRSRVQRQVAFIDRDPHSNGDTLTAYIEWVDVA